MPEWLYITPARFGLYRWHIVDPVRFEKDFRALIQDLGWTAQRLALGERYIAAFG